MNECVSCGKAIMEDMRFCPYCGQPVVSDETERFEPSKGEVVKAVAFPSRISGKEGMFALAFTDERIVFARIKDAAVDQAKDQLLQAGIFVPGSSAAINVSRFFEMTPREVLDESPDNFQLENSDVEAVRLAYESEGGGRYVISLRVGESSLALTLPYDRYYRDLLFRQFEGRITW